MRGERFPRVHGIIGMVVLSMVLLSALALVANRPVSWSLLMIGVTLAFALQVAATFTNPVPLALQRALAPGIC